MWKNIDGKKENKSIFHKENGVRTDRIVFQGNR